jgi:phosphomannomutase / phosphoglucomutase
LATPAIYLSKLALANSQIYLFLIIIQGVQSIENESRLFGTNGVRGIFGKTLSLDMIIDLVHSFGTYWEGGHIIVGSDGRKSSHILSEVVQASLNSDGFQVDNAGHIPTPCLQYSTKKHGYAGGIMITASHNPPEYNGLKPIAKDGVEISRQDELTIEKIYRDKQFKKSIKLGLTHSREFLDSYMNAVIALVDSEKIRSRKFKIVMDLGNGVQALVAPTLCEKLGCKIIPLNGNIDGDFPGRGSEPTPENLSQMSLIVKSAGANFGVAYDGDGDRSLFCDNEGEVKWGDRTGGLLVNYLLAEKHKKVEVVCPINTTAVVSKIVNDLGSIVRYTKVGSVEVSREMINKKALLGLEENGGFMYGALNEVRDGAMTTALMLDMLANTETTLSTMYSMLPTVYQYKTKFSISDSSKIEKIVQACMNHGNPTKVETLDGVKIWIDDETWIMIRPSGTEPILRMYAESNDKALLNSKVKEYTILINELLEVN